MVSVEDKAVQVDLVRLLARDARNNRARSKAPRQMAEALQKQCNIFNSVYRSILNPLVCLARKLLPIGSCMAHPLRSPG